MAGPRHRADPALNKWGHRRGPVTGLLGGSFNPAHGGHRRISLSAIKALGLDEVWWLVSPGNPLKEPGETAPLASRYARAFDQARRARIRVTALERDLGSAFTADTLHALVNRWPKRRFVWIMGSDNLAQFHRWRNWRSIACMMPIAVVARPGYDAAAVASPAMVWLRKFRKDVASFRNRGEWSAPALIELRFDPDPRSATAFRRADPNWPDRFTGRLLRDQVTHDPVITDPVEVRS